MLQVFNTLSTLSVLSDLLLLNNESKLWPPPSCGGVIMLTIKNIHICHYDKMNVLLKHNQSLTRCYRQQDSWVRFQLIPLTTSHTRVHSPDKTPTQSPPSFLTTQEYQVLYYSQYNLHLNIYFLYSKIILI